MNIALILNVFAVVISFFSGFVYAGLTEDSMSDAFISFFKDPVVYRLFALVALSFVLCVVNKIMFDKKSHAIFVWVYVASVVASVAYFAIFSPGYFWTVVCGTGVLFPVAPILQVIAALKLMKTTK